MADQVVNADSRFTLLAVRKDNPVQLLQLDVPWERLMTDVVTPYDSGDMFFIDGAAIKATDLDRLKILLNGPGFEEAFADLNWHLRTGEAKKKEMYAKQYNVFMEAMIREHCRDVTAQVISAFRTAIKPGLKDRLPDKDALFGAGIQLFVEAMKAWTNHH